jgi:hypothetical protein
MKIKKIKNLPVNVFDRLLDNYGLKKTVFATHARIPYPTVAGWTNTGKVPLYAFELAKHIIRELGLKKDIKQIHLHNRKNNNTLAFDEADFLKKVEVAFWGKNISPKEAVQKALNGDKNCCLNIMKNLYHKDATRLLGPKRVKLIAKAHKDELGERLCAIYRHTF